MHVAIDAINFNDHIRGPDRYLISLLTALAERDDETRYTIFYASWQGHYAALPLPERFRFVRCRPFRQRTARVLWHATVFPGIVSGVRPDLLHLPNLIYLPRMDLPVVLTVHDLAHYRYPEKFGRLRSLLLRRLLHRTVGNADAVIAVSEHTRGDIVRFLGYPEARIRVVLEGGPLSVRPPPPAAAAKPYFLYVGQLERSKNVETLIRGFLGSARLREQGAELWIAGRMDNAEQEIRRALADSDGRVRLLGYVPDADLPGLYAACQAFVFPSLIEGFGLVLLEAMSYGAPVIAADANVIPEVVGDAGLLVDALDPRALGDAMERIDADPALRADLRRRGYERLKRFSWDRAAEETLRVYAETLHGAQTAAQSAGSRASRTSA